MIGTEQETITYIGLWIINVLDSQSVERHERNFSR